ncbi:MAG: GNAT family N-acetyltransferase [Christensenellales bacterium]
MNPVHIRHFTENDIDYVIARHKALYQEEYHLSPVFSAYVEKVVRCFARDFDREKECMLIPECDGRPVGSVAIAKTNEETAQFRYYLLEPFMRGKGIGRRLIDLAIDFCRDKGYSHVFLTTISALKAARHLYASKGFRLTHAEPKPAWGEGVVEERWELDL